MIIETAKMSERGQVIIPKEVREQVHAEKNTIFTVTALDSNTVIMKKLDTKKISEEFRNIRARSLKTSPSLIDKEIHALRKRRSRH